MSVLPTYEEWTRLEERLAWQYGDKHAETILNGDDIKTEMDLARWNALGRKGDQAA
jgi:hypothetical protein